MHIAENLSDISLHYFNLARQIASKFDLTLSQALVLLYIPFDGITISHLSHKLGVDISTMTRNIQRIEKKGFLERILNADDKRSVKLLLSSKGQKISTSLNEEIKNHIHEIINKYDIDKSQSINNNLETLSWDLYLYRENIK